MDLRPELNPPTLDDALVAHLAKLADRIDGARPGEWDKDVAEFNRLAGTDFPPAHFQGVYGGGTHADFVRRVFTRRTLAPDPRLTLVEMTEVVSRIFAGGRDIDFYVALFAVSCRHPSGTNLIFWPDGIPGLPVDRDPTADEVARLASADYG